MATDIRLDEFDGNWVVVDSAVLKCTASDLMLDAPSRNGNGEMRRALVHDSGDGLTMNFNGDYPGGITLTGDVHVTGRLMLGNADEATELLAGLRNDVAELRMDITRYGLHRIDLIEESLASLAALLDASFIPPWQTQEEVERGDDMGVLYLSAADLGLHVEWIILQAEPGLEHGQVVRIDPKPGTAVRRGSTVRVTINLHG